MTIETACALLVAMIISAAIPGPGVFACIAKAFASGFRGTLYIICGIILGNILFFILAVLGLSALAQVLGEMMIWIKWIGGAYLFWLGWKMWKAEPVVLDVDRTLTGQTHRSGLVVGLIVPFSNPKVILFYVSLLPSFVDLSSLSFFDCLMAASLVALALLAVLSGYSLLAARARHLLTSRRAAKNLNRGAGITMMGTGIIIATQSN